jgi:hypothetical protein
MSNAEKARELLESGEEVCRLREMFVQSPTPGIISHFMFGIEGYDAGVLRAKLAPLDWSRRRTPTVSTFVTRMG